MESTRVNTLSPKDDTVSRWISNLATPIDLVMDILEPEIGSDGYGTNPTSEEEKNQDETTENFELLETENAQRITTQDLMEPSPIAKNKRKRCRCESKENQEETGYNSESAKIPAWLRAENGMAQD